MKQMNNLLGLYGGCDNDELKRIRKLPSRWVALCTTFPSMVIYERGAYLLHGEQPGDEEGSELVAPRRESGLNGPSNAAAASPHTRGEKRPRAASEEEQREERYRYSRN